MPFLHKCIIIVMPNGFQNEYTSGFAEAARFGTSFVHYISMCFVKTLRRLLLAVNRIVLTIPY